MGCVLQCLREGLGGVMPSTLGQLCGQNLDQAASSTLPGLIYSRIEMTDQLTVQFQFMESPPNNADYGVRKHYEELNFSLFEH